MLASVRLCGQNTTPGFAPLQASIHHRIRQVIHELVQPTLAHEVDAGRNDRCRLLCRTACFWPIGRVSSAAISECIALCALATPVRPV